MEPLYAQINRELKTKQRLHSTLSVSNALDTSDQYDSDTVDSKVIYQNLMANVSSMNGLAGLGALTGSMAALTSTENRTDAAKLQSAAVSSANYKHINSNSTKYGNVKQNQWIWSVIGPTHTKQQNINEYI